jgi:group I intron endonuclease
MSFLKKSKTTKVISEEPVKEDNAKIQGVYAIKCKTNNKYYIGSTMDLDRRFKTHKQHLEKGCHNCRILQRDYDEYGLDEFEFIVLERNIDEDLLTAYEKYYIYQYDAIVMYKGYNEKMPTNNHRAFKLVCERMGYNARS